MTLGFSTLWEDGVTPTHFPEKIQLPYVQGIQKYFPDMLPKIHCFRASQIWRAGMDIHMVTGYSMTTRNQFNRGIPELGKCVSVQNAIIRNIDGDGLSIELLGDLNTESRFLTEQELLLFAANDGFNSIDELEDWFFSDGNSDIHEGQIIHWTTFKY
jgi:hypothetical protein